MIVAVTVMPNFAVTPATIALAFKSAPTLAATLTVPLTVVVKVDCAFVGVPL